MIYVTNIEFACSSKRQHTPYLFFANLTVCMGTWISKKKPECIACVIEFKIIQAKLFYLLDYILLPRILKCCEREREKNENKN